MSKIDQSKEIWSLIEKTLPENNKERLTEAEANKGVRLIPGLQVSSFKQWSPDEIAVTIMTRLEPPQNAEQVRKEIQSSTPAQDALLNPEKVIAVIKDELKNNSCCLALESPSEILFYSPNDSEIYIKKLDANTFAYCLFWVDGVERRPLLLIDEFVITRTESP